VGKLAVYSKQTQSKRSLKAQISGMLKSIKAQEEFQFKITIICIIYFV
jgi:hypothetical protein